MQRKPSPPEEFIENVVGLSMTVGKTTADDMDADVLIELAGSHGKVLKMLDHLVARVRHTALEVLITELRFAVGQRSVGPCENWRDNHERSLLALVLMKRLSEDLDNLLSLVKVGATDQVNDNMVSTDHRLAKGLGLFLVINDLDQLVRGRNDGCILLDHSACEFVALFAVTDSLVIVSHALEQGVSDQTVDSREEDSLAFFRLRHLHGWLPKRALTSYTGACRDSITCSIHR